jgi:5-formyltetrahydrofolate cyclo-ligase
MRGAERAEAKRQARAQLSAVLGALLPEDVLHRGARAQARLLATPEFRAARTVALYAALPGEVPTDALFAQALAQGKTVAFPVVPAEGRQLLFRTVEEPAHLVPGGRLSIREPLAGRPCVELSAIELFVVPGLGFTRQGHRLGRGAGYYDATLALAPASTPRIGLAFSEQVLEGLPSGEEDVPVHQVVTEEMAFAATGAPPTVVGARPRRK